MKTSSRGDRVNARSAWTSPVRNATRLHASTGAAAAWRTRCSRLAGPRRALRGTARATTPPAPDPTSWRPQRPMLPTIAPLRQRTHRRQGQHGRRLEDRLVLPCGLGLELGPQRRQRLARRQAFGCKATCLITNGTPLLRSDATSSGGVLMVCASRADVRSRPSSN